MVDFTIFQAVGASAAKDKVIFELQAKNAKLTAERDWLVKNQAKRDLESGAKHIYNALLSVNPSGEAQEYILIEVMKYANQLTKQAEGMK